MKRVSEREGGSRGRVMAMDAVKLMAIFLVLWGHCILHLQGHSFNVWDNPVYRWISSFHMPLFMCVSGFFGAKVMEIPLRDHLMKKFRQLILPAATMGIIFCISWCYVVNGGGGFIGSWIRCYWFLKSAFICSVLYYFTMRLPFRPLPLLLTLIISQFIYIYQVNIMYPAFLLGAWLFNHRSTLMARSWVIFAVTAPIYLIMLFNWDSAMAHSWLIRLHHYVLDPSLISGRVIYCQLYKVVMGLAGSCATIALFIGLGKILPGSATGSAVIRWGMFTLGIYLLQAVIIEHWMMITIDLRTMDWGLFNFVVAPALSLVVLIISLLIIKLIHKSPLFSFLLLGESNEKYNSILRGIAKPRRD